MVRPSLASISFAVLLLSSSAFAAGDESKDFYLRFESGFFVPSSLKSDGKLGGGDQGEISVANYNNKAPKSSIIYGGVLGYRFSDHFRADFNVSGRNYSFKQTWDQNVGYGTPVKYNVSQKISTVAMMLNGYYDIGKYGIVTPYINAGAKIAFNKAVDYKTGYERTRL